MTISEGFKAGCAVFAGLILVVLLVTALAFYAGLVRLPLMNLERQVTTHSQQYVQTQQQVILNYYGDWVAAPDAAHKEAAVIHVCSTAALLDPNEYPAQVNPFIAANCR